MISWKELTIQMESDDDTCSCWAMLGNATLQIEPSSTDRNNPQKVVAMA